MSTKLSKPIVKGALPPVAGTADHKRGYSVTWDSEIPGLGLLVTIKGVKSFVVRARIKGKERRHTLGRASVLGVDTARDLARAWLGKIAGGGDPVEEKRTEAVSAVTLRQAMAQYFASGRARQSTQTLITDRFQRRLPDWLDLPLVRISEDMVERRFLEIGESHEADANITFRYFRAVWKLAAVKTEDASGKQLLPKCPTDRLNKARLWKKDVRRKRAIQAHQFKDFLASVDALPDQRARLALRFVLHTGCRISEAAGLTWANVDERAGTAHFVGTKSRSNPDHTIPLTKQTRAILQDAKSIAVGAYVFGDALGNRRKNPFANEINKIRKTYGEFGPHDLRRTYITTAKAAGVDPGATKRLVNHSTGGDVTEGYDASTLEALRAQAQRISDLLDSYAAGGAEIIPMLRQG